MERPPDADVEALGGLQGDADALLRLLVAGRVECAEGGVRAVADGVVAVQGLRDLVVRLDAEQPSR